MDRLPLVTVAGAAREVGEAHGAQARDRIEANRDLYFRRFREEWGVSPRDARQRALRYEDVLRRGDAAYRDAVEGVATGADLPFEDVLALNLRYEIVYSEYSRRGQAAQAGALPGGCTAVALLPERTRDGRLLMAQNWDWIPGIQGVVLRYWVGAGPGILGFTEAGIVGPKIGLNDAGLGLLINGLVSDRDDWARLGVPFHVRCWQVLGSRTLEEAVTRITGPPSSCSANFLVAQVRDGRAEAVDVELSPAGAELLRPRDGVLTHANHFHRADALGVAEPLLEERTSTFHRQRRIDALVGTLPPGGAADPAAVMGFLRDHRDAPRSLCRHPEPQLPETQRYQTVVSVVLEPEAGLLRVAAGPPCEAPYAEYPLEGGAHSRTR